MGCSVLETFWIFPPLAYLSTLRRFSRNSVRGRGWIQHSVRELGQHSRQKELHVAGADGVLGRRPTGQGAEQHHETRHGPARGRAPDRTQPRGPHCRYVRIVVPVGQNRPDNGYVDVDASLRFSFGFNAIGVRTGPGRHSCSQKQFLVPKNRFVLINYYCNESGKEISQISNSLNSLFDKSLLRCILL